MKNYIIILVVLVGIFSACKKNLNSIDQAISNSGSLTDIETANIPDNFNWKTTKTLDVQIILPHSQGLRRTKITSVDSKLMYFKGYPSDTTQRVLSTKITVPSYLEVLKISNGMTEVFADIIGNTLSYDFNNSSFKNSNADNSLCGECDGQVKQLTLQYTGTANNPLIVVLDNKDNELFNGNVQGDFSFFGVQNKQKMGPKIRMYVNGNYSVEIHTSCSVPILAGQHWGDFLIVSGESVDGGPLCQVEDDEPISYEGTVIYEDLFPAKGDYDFNDLVVEYVYEITNNNNNYVDHIEASFTVKAFGASYHNAFGFQFPGVTPNNVTSVTGYVLKPNTIFNMSSNGTEANQSVATFIVYDDAYNIMTHPGSGIGVNTTPGSDYVTPVTINMTINFAANSVLFDDLDIGNFNPFIVMKQDRGYEVHLAGFEPTDLFDTGLYGVYDDASVPGSGIYFVTENNLPWAINIPDGFDYMKEKAKISTGYLKFVEWAQSGGTHYTDWYLDLPGYRDNNQLYQIP